MKTVKKHIALLKANDQILYDGHICTVTSDAHIHDSGSCREWRIAVNPLQTGMLYLYASHFEDFHAVVVLPDDTTEDTPATREDGDWTAFPGGHRFFGNDYVLSGIPNAFNKKVGWWLSKKGCTAAMYCFSTSGSELAQLKEAQYQMRAIESYIQVYEARFNKEVQA